MVKPNFFVTAAALNLGLLGVSALSYWLTNRNQQENGDEDDSSTAQSPSGNVSHEERVICGVCLHEIALNPIKTLVCGHKVHKHCFYQMEKDSLTCPTCSRERND